MFCVFCIAVRWKTIAVNKIQTMTIKLIGREMKQRYNSEWASASCLQWMQGFTVTRYPQWSSFIYLQFFESTHTHTHQWPQFRGFFHLDSPEARLISCGNWFFFIQKVERVRVYLEHIVLHKPQLMKKHLWKECQDHRRHALKDMRNIRLPLVCSVRLVVPAPMINLSSASHRDSYKLSCLRFPLYFLLRDCTWHYTSHMPSILSLYISGYMYWGS